jgi:hypothetical protein
MNLFYSNQPGINLSVKRTGLRTKPYRTPKRVLNVSSTGGSRGFVQNTQQFLTAVVVLTMTNQTEMLELFYFPAWCWVVLAVIRLQLMPLNLIKTSAFK